MYIMYLTKYTEMILNMKTTVSSANLIISGSDYAKAKFKNFTLKKSRYICCLNNY